MKSKPLFLLIVPLLSIFPIIQTLADPAVTFEVLASFDYPGASSTIANVIDDRGRVGGWCAFHHSTVRGFIRFGDGQFSAPIREPESSDGSTYVTGLNNTGITSGYYATATGDDGFLYSDSTFTTVHMAAAYTDVQKVNDAGNYCGTTILPNAAFVNIGGTVTTFVVPGADGTGAEGINNLDQVVGAYTVGATTYGYRRDADGTFVYPFAVPGAWFTALRSINDHGWMVGTVASLTTGTQGVLFRPSGEFVLYGYPGAGVTTFNGINSRGVICGNYYDEQGNPHGFIVRARAASEE
jgi:hypothetical protein